MDYARLLPVAKYVVVLVLFQLLPASRLFSQSFINPSLEDWADTSLCEINIPPDYWFNFSNSGAGPDEANYPLCPSSIPGRASQGRVYARFMAGNPVSGEGMHQVVLGFSPGRTYRLSFDYAGSNRWGGTDTCHFLIYLNGAVTDSTPTFSSTDTTWRRYFVSFTAPSTAIDFGFRAMVPHYQSAGGSAAIDNFSFQESLISDVSTEKRVGVVLYPNPFRDELRVSCPGSSVVYLELKDIFGRTVFEKEIPEGEAVHTSSLTTGCYVALVHPRGGELHCFRIFKD
jgi:hypothetical protein